MHGAITEGTRRFTEVLNIYFSVSASALPFVLSLSKDEWEMYFMVQQAHHERHISFLICFNPL